MVGRGCPLVSLVLPSHSTVGPRAPPEVSVAPGHLSAGVPGGHGHVKGSGLSLEEAEVGVIHSTLNREGSVSLPRQGWTWARQLEAARLGGGSP